MEKLEAIENDAGDARLEPACSLSYTNSTADDLAGPGRAIDKLYTYAGIRLELLIGKVAVAMGKGPLATAQRIRRNRSSVICMTNHGEWCRCDTRSTKSSRSLIKAHREISKDCIRLIRYVKSKEFSTREQAVESILDLSIWDGELRAILKANGARQMISNSIEIARRFHPSANDALLHNSRKALLCLDDTALISLLKTSTSMLEISLGLGRDRLASPLKYMVFQSVDEQLHPLWRRILAYLSRPELAFIILRYLKRFAAKILEMDHVSLFQQVIRKMGLSPVYFEWTECEEMLCDAFSVSVNYTSLILIFAADWILRNAHMIPRVFEITQLRLLTEHIHELNNNDFSRHQALQFDFFKDVRIHFGPDISVETLKNRYRYTKLHPFLEILASSTMKTVVAYPGRDLSDDYRYLQGPSKAEKLFFRRIARHIHSADSAARTMAWAYLNYFMGHDIYRCKVVLGMLSQTSFKPPEGLQTFIENKLDGCVPRKAGLDLRPYHRYIDVYGRTYYIVGHSKALPCEKPVAVARMEVPLQWTLGVNVRRGKAFSVDKYHPLIEERDDYGRRSFLARIDLADGMRPEDLRVEMRCSHRSVLAIPEAFTVYVLRYPPKAYAAVLELGTDSLYTTGPFSWTDSKIPKERKYDVREHQTRLLTIEEAAACGYTRKEIFPETSGECYRALPGFGHYCESYFDGRFPILLYESEDGDGVSPFDDQLTTIRVLYERAITGPEESSEDVYHVDEPCSQDHGNEFVLSADNGGRFCPLDDQSENMHSGVNPNELSARQEDESVSTTSESLPPEKSDQDKQVMTEDTFQEGSHGGINVAELDVRIRQQPMFKQGYMFFVALMLLSFVVFQSLSAFGIYM